MTLENTEAETQTNSTPNEVQLPPKADNESNADYLRRLRDENKKHRESKEAVEAQVKELERKLQEADQDKVKSQSEIEKIKTEARNQVALNKIEAVAAKEGALDTDVIEKLLDPAQFEFADDGKIKNAAELVSQLKADKPYLFGNISTASTSKAPTPSSDGPRKVSEMSAEEKKAHYKKMGL